MQIGDAAAARLVALTDAADAAAQNNLGVVLQRGGRVADAQRAFNRAVALDGAMSVARRNLRALPADGAAVTAAARWARVRADATDDDAWRALVRHHTARGEFEAAADALGRWDAAAATAVAPAVERARWAVEAGYPDVALAAVARARAGAGAHALAGDVALVASLDLLEARAAYQRGDAAHALVAVERVRVVTPDDADAELLRSFLLGELGAAHAAAASRARAAALDPAFARVDAGLLAAPVDAGAGGGRADAATGTAGSDSVLHVLAMAAALRHKGYYDEALCALAAHGHGGDERVHVVVRAALGIVHLQRGAAADALPVLSEAVRAPGLASADAGRHALAFAVAQLLVGNVDDADAAARAVAHDAVAHDAGAALVWAGATTVRALVAWRRGDLSSARAYLLDAAAQARGLDDTVRAALAADLALLLVDAGAGAAAVAAGAAAARLAPRDAAAHAAHARALSHVGDHAGARGAFARACTLAPDDAAVRYGLAFAAGSCGDRSAARTELARATALSPVVRGPAPRVIVDADGPLLLPSDGSGVRVPAAHESVEPADVAGADAGPAHDYAHVDARLAAGEYERALAAADAALARGAPAAEGLVRAGHALARSGQVALALDRYTRAAAAAPFGPGPELHVVRALHRLGRLGDACVRASAAVERWPDDPSFAAVLARAAADRGAVDDAVNALERCARAPRDAIGAGDVAAFWGDVACAWQALGAWDAAADAWAEASRAVPALPSPTLARARALARAGRADAADAVLQALADRAPELPDVWRARAELAMAAGQLPAARAHLARVVGRDAGDVDALAALAAACVDASRLDDARAAAAHAISLEPEHPLALAVEGDCAAAAGDVVGACDAWSRALAASPVGAGAARARAGLRGSAVIGAAVPAGPVSANVTGLL